MLKFFRKVKIADRAVSQFQDNVANILQPLSKLPLLDGVLVEFTFTSGSNQVNHTLGRAPLGWIPVDSDTADTIYKTAQDSATITFTLSGACTKTLYIF